MNSNSSYSARDLHYSRTGSGPPIVLLHGNPATHSLWRPLVGPLSEHHTVYAIDLPGFGRSPAPSDHHDYSVERIAGLIAVFIGEHGLGCVDVIGHSFGGAVAATLAARHPELVRSLALITPLTDLPPPAARAAHNRSMRLTADMLWRVAPGRLRDAMSRRGARISYGSAYSRDRAEEIAREMNRSYAVRNMSELMTHVDYRALAGSLNTLAELDIPLLLVGAGRDSIVPFDHFKHLCEMIPRAEQKIFPEGSHVPMWQYPQELRETVERFLRSDG